MAIAHTCTITLGIDIIILGPKLLPGGIDASSSWCRGSQIGILGIDSIVLLGVGGITLGMALLVLKLEAALEKARSEGSQKFERSKLRLLDILMPAARTLRGESMCPGPIEAQVELVEDREIYALPVMMRVAIGHEWPEKIDGDRFIV
ncbi:hypothetical protein K474DRAFT_1680261 [Panus rudis PR-1116 ss-1]|nr:hypothetical protein K474DRAFT_1680261 [Panus rudis PR-1116 ss-1]